MENLFDSHQKVVVYKYLDESENDYNITIPFYLKNIICNFQNYDEIIREYQKAIFSISEYNFTLYNKFLHSIFFDIARHKTNENTKNKIFRYIYGNFVSYCPLEGYMHDYEFIKKNWESFFSNMPKDIFIEYIRWINNEDFMYSCYYSSLPFVYVKYSTMVIPISELKDMYILANGNGQRYPFLDGLLCRDDLCDIKKRYPPLAIIKYENFLHIIKKILSHFCIYDEPRYAFEEILHSKDLQEHFLKKIYYKHGLFRYIVLLLYDILCLLFFPFVLTNYFFSEKTFFKLLHSIRVGYCRVFCS